MSNKTKITITWIKDYGRNHDMFCNKVLGLRTARRAGDSEIVNHSVLGRLRDMGGQDIEFNTEEQ